SKTECFVYTPFTGGIYRNALQGSKFHYGLVIGCSIVFWQKFLCKYLELLLTFRTGNIIIDPKHPRQYPVDISINNGHSLIEGKRCNCCGGVLAYAFQKQ